MDNNNNGQPKNDFKRNDGKKPFSSTSNRTGGSFNRGGQGGQNRGFGRPKSSDGKPSFGKSPSGDRPYADRGNRPSAPRGDKPAFAKPMGDKPAFSPKENGAPIKAITPQPKDNPRMVALLAFSNIMQKDAFASQAINEQLKTKNLTQLDKRFCTRIVYTTVENLLAIDFALSFFLKSQENMESHVRDILRLSVCQYLFMDKVPDSAICDEAVKLTREIGMEPLTGLVNGVLRNMMRSKEDIKWPEKEEDLATHLSICHSMPKWIVHKLMEAYGDEMAEKIVSHRTKDHYMVLRRNMLQLTEQQFEALLEKKVWLKEKGLVPNAYRVRDVSSVALDADYLGGKFSIQGEASMLCAQIADAKRGMQVLDCCAAPGGKTAYMAEMMGGTGRVYAWDLHEHRVALLNAMKHRLKLDSVRPTVRDASVLKEDLINACDLVLLDAPCTGLGVSEDKPDIKYRATENNLNELVSVQGKLLETCARYVKKGGTMVYSTCSILPQENEEQVKTFLENHPEFVLDQLPSTVDPLFTEKMGEYGLQLLPARDEIEGFFIARLKKIKN